MIFRNPNNRTKPYQFDYKPRYYDPEEEKAEKRRRELERQMEINERAEAGDEDAIKERSRRRMNRMYRAEANQARKRAALRSNIMLMGIIGLLLFATYFIIEHYLPQIEAWVGKMNF